MKKNTVLATVSSNQNSKANRSFQVETGDVNHTDRYAQLLGLRAHGTVIAEWMNGFSEPSTKFPLQSISLCVSALNSILDQDIAIYKKAFNVANSVRAEPKAVRAGKSYRARAKQAKTMAQRSTKTLNKSIA